MNWRGQVVAIAQHINWRGLAFALGLVVVAGIICDGMWWQMQWFPLYAFFDPGWALTTNHLLEEGLVPTRDFAYTYGLSSLLVIRGIFALFGATPAVSGAIILVAELAMLAGVWRLVRNLELGWAARGLVILLTPLVLVPGSVPSPTHAIEAALLTHALAYHARNRLGHALVLATLAVTVKPALGYIYGFVLLVQILSTKSPSGHNRLWRILPAAVVGLTVLGILISTFGIDPVLRTQFTSDARKEYADLKAGFFSELGSPFWHGIIDYGLSYFFWSEFGVWSACTVALLFGTRLAIRRYRTDAAAPVIVALTVWHVLFVLFFWGNDAAWIYYPYVPFVGGPIVIDRLGQWMSRKTGQRILLIGGIIIAALAVRPTKGYISRGYNPRPPDISRSEITGGLFASEQEIAAWERVRKLAQTDGPVFAIYRMGCAPILFPEVGGPRSWYLSEVIATPAEKARVRAGIAEAKWLVVSTFITYTLPEWVKEAAYENGFDLDNPTEKSDDDRTIFTLHIRCVPRNK